MLQCNMTLTTGDQMPGLSDVLRRLAEQRADIETGPQAPSRLRRVDAFGANPGRLRMFDYAPPTRATRPALVVVLHGCTQSAAGYDHASGWSRLADEDGFVLLFPEQTHDNNAKGCFNWFLPEHTARGAGEAASIRQMIDHAVAEHGVDRGRIYVTGLSAGGAMASVMLATYPETFAGGAIIAGLPYGAARDVPGAFKAMFTGAPRDSSAWGDLVRNAAPAPARWPRVEVWHGTDDQTVRPVNGEELVKQWTDVHGLRVADGESDTLAGARRRIFRDSAGEARVTHVVVPGLAHGAPLDTRPDAPGRGVAAPFMLEASLSSTYWIARAFDVSSERRPSQAPAPKAERDAFAPNGHGAGHSIRQIIADALRKAGLLKN
jgi:poly(hydroxyalkanoate) depolymerase family esterase